VTNYNNQSGTAAIAIAKADANVTITPYSGIYDAAAHHATGTATGVGGVDLSAGLNLGASFTNAPGGTANWTFTGGTNYNDTNGSVNIAIAKADLSITVGHVTKTFGQPINLANMLGTTIYTGVNGEKLSMSHICAGTQPAALVGDYAINCVMGNGTGLLSNYNVAVIPGTLTVATPSVITTVQDGANLIIVGTGGSDNITVNATNPNSITVNGTGSYSVGVGGHVIVYGMASDDNISLIGNINIEAHGGDGNDTITGGAGHDVIFGDTGDDTLTGAAGNDVLVGGSGSDRLVGSAGHDILISGNLTGTDNGNAYDYNTLRLISDNWAAANASADPDLESPDDDVVDESGSADQLTGSAGHDWFIIGSTDKITDINSKTKDGDKITYI
jgi:Ca2+-binding RTX toxin-like protein